MKSNDAFSILSRIIRRLFLPIVTFALKRQLTCQQLVQILEHTCVDAAVRRLSANGEAANMSRIAAFTGLSRRAVERNLKEGPLTSQDNSGIISKILGAWEQDRRYRHKGQPRSLSCEGGASEFWALCESISKTINPGTILFELEHSGAIERRGGVAIFRRPQISIRNDEEHAYELLSEGLNALIQAVEKNISAKTELDQQLHYQTEYDRIRASKVLEVRQWIYNEGREFHRRVREYLSAHDMDINPVSSDANESPVKVVVGSFAAEFKPDTQTS